MKKNLRTYLNFSKKERIGIITLCLLSLFLILLPYWVSRKELPDLETLTSAEKEWTAAFKKVKDSSEKAFTPVQLFPFDPNLISSAEWQKLGVSGILTKRILNYRNKGGRFRQADDLKKIWGMPEEQARQLIPYVRLTGLNTAFRKEKTLITPIDINTADTAEWKSLPGIGNVLAQRIIKHRERWGAYAAPEELRLVFGLKDSLLLALKPYLLVHETTIKKQPINSASAYLIELKTGVPGELAKAIVRWRQEKGHFTEIEELLQVPGFEKAYIPLFKRVFTIY